MAQAKTSTQQQEAQIATIRANVQDLVSGVSVNELYVISDLQLRKGGKTGSYVTFTSSDASGRIRGVYWPEHAGHAEALIQDIQDGSVCRVKADVVSYRGTKELRVSPPKNGISPYTGTWFDPEPFVPTAGVSERELRDAVEVRIGLIGDRHLRRILRVFFADKNRGRDYFRLPASLTHHHAYRRGLAETAVETARIAGAAAASIPGVDRDLVTAAALLAPAGALLGIQEDGLGWTQTQDGTFLHPGHLAAQIAVKAAREVGRIPEDTVCRLQHVIFTATGYGGPGPVLPESITLRYALAISQQVQQNRDQAGGSATWS